MDVFIGKAGELDDSFEAFTMILGVYIQRSGDNYRVSANVLMDRLYDGIGNDPIYQILDGLGTHKGMIYRENQIVGGWIFSNSLAQGFQHGIGLVCVGKGYAFDSGIIDGLDDMLRKKHAIHSRFRLGYAKAAALA